MKRKIANPNFQKSWTLSPKPCGFLQLIHKINYKIIKSTPSAMKSILIFLNLIYKMLAYPRSMSRHDVDFIKVENATLLIWLAGSNGVGTNEKWPLRFCFSFDFLLLSNCGRVDWGSWCRRRVHMQNDAPHSPVVNKSFPFRSSLRLSDFTAISPVFY